jgi:hypothetical protein
MRFIGLLMVAGVIAFSNGAEGQNQVLDGGQGVLWVKDKGEVPENAIRDRIGEGLPLCRGTLSEDEGEWWRDIGVRKDDGVCHTLRAEKGRNKQETFYYLVPAHEGGISMAGMVPEAEVQAAVDVAVAQLTARMEQEVQARITEITKRLVAWGWDASGVIEAAEAEVRAEMVAEVEYWRRRCGKEE